MRLVYIWDHATNQVVAEGMQFSNGFFIVDWFTGFWKPGDDMTVARYDSLEDLEDAMTGNFDMQQGEVVRGYEFNAEADKDVRFYERELDKLEQQRLELLKAVSAAQQKRSPGA